MCIHIAVYYGVTRPRTKPPEPVRQVEVEYFEAPKIKRRPPKPPRMQQVVEQDRPAKPAEEAETKFLSSHSQKVTKETRAKSTGHFQNGGQGLKDLSEQFAMKEKGDLPQKAESEKPRSQTDDYLEELEEGMATLVNTREFAYFAYFNAIKESLRRQWEPELRDKMTIIRRKDRELASEGDQASQLLVTLNRHGGLIRVEVLRSSGTAVLDKLATDAFKRAAPFPNPPAGIVESDGTVKIRWDFILAN